MKTVQFVINSLTEAPSIGDLVPFHCSDGVVGEATVIEEDSGGGPKVRVYFKEPFVNHHYAVIEHTRNTNGTFSNQKRVVRKETFYLDIVLGVTGLDPVVHEVLCISNE